MNAQEVNVLSERRMVEPTVLGDPHVTVDWESDGDSVHENAVHLHASKVDRGQPSLKQRIELSKIEMGKAAGLLGSLNADTSLDFALRPVDRRSLLFSGRRCVHGRCFVGLLHGCKLAPPCGQNYERAVKSKRSARSE